MSKCEDCKHMSKMLDGTFYCDREIDRNSFLYVQLNTPACGEFEPKFEEAPGLECIDTMRLIFGDKSVSEFCMIRGFELLWEHEDLDKAEWYLNKSHDLDPNKLYDEKWTTLGEMVARRRAKKEG